MDSKKSCKDCQDRQVGCHGKCESYAERRAASEKEYERRRVQCQRDFDFEDFKLKSIEKAVRKHKWWA